MHRHDRHTERPAAQTLEGMSSTILSIAAAPGDLAPCDQLLAAAVYAARVSETLTWSTVRRDLLRETADVAMGRVLAGVLNPSWEIGDSLDVLQLRAARLLATAAMGILDGRDTLPAAVRAVDEMVAAMGDRGDQTAVGGAVSA